MRIDENLSKWENTSSLFRTIQLKNKIGSGSKRSILKDFPSAHVKKSRLNRSLLTKNDYSQVVTVKKKLPTKIF